EAGDERCRLAEVTPKPDDPNVVHLAVETCQRCERSVRRAVVDEDRLPFVPDGLERRAQLVVEQRDASFLVVHGDDDGDHGARLLAFRLRGEMADLLSLADAQGRVLARVEPLGTEAVAVGEAAGRFLAGDALAAVDLPPFPSSAMDGFALRASDTPGRLPVVARIAAGVPAPRPLRGGEAMAIATGGVVPEGADVVVPIESVVEADNSVEINEAVVQNAHIRPRRLGRSRRRTAVRSGRRGEPSRCARACAGERRRRDLRRCFGRTA